MKSIIDTNIIIALEKLSQVNRIFLWDIAKEEKISPLHIQFLEFISNNDFNNNTVSNLAREFDLKKSTISESINKLVEKKLIEKKEDILDKRKFYLVLTEEGKEKLEKISKKMKLFYEILNVFEEGEKEVVSLFLMKFLKKLHEMGIIKVVKMCLNCENFRKNVVPESDKPHFCNFLKVYVDDKELHFNCIKFKEKGKI